MAPLPRDATTSEPLWHLVYRYWFWQWLFVDVNRGDLVRRAAAWRHNLAQRIHLPVYMRRWCVCLLVMFGIAAVIEALGGRATAAVFYVASVISATIELTAGVAWVFLRPR
ncbi:MAG TPA: hypothetical protein VNE58_04700 [Casimicrobiaceae bacterium]|nr:hypothetical protein [Casimicrobiaceae bacterium]